MKRIKLNTTISEVINFEDSTTKQNINDYIHSHINQLWRVLNKDKDKRFNNITSVIYKYDEVDNNENH